MKKVAARTKVVNGILLVDPIQTNGGWQYPTKDVFLDDLGESETANPTVPYCYSCGRAYASNKHFTVCPGCGWRFCGHPKCKGMCDCDVQTAELLDEMDAQYGNAQKRKERASLEAKHAPSDLEDATDMEFPDDILNRMNYMLMCNMLEELRAIRNYLDPQSGD